jgi:Tol biopolymer transport system component
VYVIPFPDGGRKYLACREESVYPNWSPDGKELRFVTLSGEIQATTVDGSGSSFRVGQERTLLQGPSPTGTGQHWDFDPDTGYILMCAEEAVRDETAFLEYVSDWPRGLMR